jgi:hypothetical protein
VAQYEHGALTRRQAPERIQEFGTLLEPGQPIPSRQIGDNRCHVELTAPPSPAPGAIESEVDEDSASVGGRPLHAPHARPPPGDLQQTLLNEILRLAGVPCDQVGRLHKLLEIAANERVEIVHHRI